MTTLSYAETARKMTDAELYGFFSKDHFYQDANLAAAVCQEVENREAALTGRKPARIEFKKFDNPNVMGYAGRDVICVNTCFLESKYQHRYTPEGILNTILHEGRHYWQRQVTLNPELECPNALRLQFVINQLAYVNTGNAIDLGMDAEIQARLQYGMQENEMDARYYALKRMREISERYRKDYPFKLEMTREVIQEIEYYRLVTENMTEEKYQLLERKYMERYNQNKEQAKKLGVLYPEAPEGKRCFENIRIYRKVIDPLYKGLLKANPQLRMNTGDQAALLFSLYRVARERILAGETLESPLELLKIGRAHV